MSIRITDKTYKLFLYGICFILSILYANCELGWISTELNYHPFFIMMVSISILYLYKYRRNNLFCFETIFFGLYILCTFFNGLIMQNLTDDSMVSQAYFYSFSTTIQNKCLVLQCLALIVFIIAASKENDKSLKQAVLKKFQIKWDYKRCSFILSILIGGLILYLFLNGTISTWFHYSDQTVNYDNAAIVYLTVLFLANTSFEFTRLHMIGCNNLNLLARKINKLYLVAVIAVSVILLISGNRNECLLILLPIIISYTIFIKRIQNKLFLGLLFIGVCLMILIGVTRHSGNISNPETTITLFETARDFGFVDNNTKYLVEYTDNSKSVFFKNSFINIVSSVPFLGGNIVSAFNIIPDKRTTLLTTEGMQTRWNDSGLGTSLIGDLYYTGSFFFVIIFMYFLGWLMANVYNRFMIQRQFSIWLLVIYLFMFSNVVYYIRAEWTMPFRYIGFSFLIIIMLQLFLRKRQFSYGA